MNPEYAIDMSRQAVKVCMLVGGPILLASLVIGLLVGIFQAMTQVQDQTVSFVPKFLLLAVVIGAGLPWLTDRMVDFARESFTLPESMTARFSPATREPGEPSTAAEQLTPTVLGKLHTPFQRASFSSQPEKQRRSQMPPTNDSSESRSFGKFNSDFVPRDQDSNDETTSKSPFILPHYRVAQEPRVDQGT